MKVRVQKVTIPGDPLLWRVGIPRPPNMCTPTTSWQSEFTRYYRTWPEAMEAALTLWEQLNCQIAT